MFYLNVVAVLALVLFSQALSLMATSLHVPRGERSGVIAPLLRNAKVSRSVAHGLHIRQSSCPMGSFKCDDGEGCCDIGFTCVVVAGKSGCCPIGRTCSGNPVCKDPTDKLCPGGEFCCPAGDQCFSNFTCGGSNNGPGGFTTTRTSTRATATDELTSSSSLLFDTSTTSGILSTTGTPLVPSSSTSSTSSLNRPPTTSSPNVILPSITSATNGAMLTASNSVFVFVAVVVGSLPFIN